MNTYDLKDSINLVSKALPKTARMPIVNNIRLQNGQLTATDLESVITTKFDSDLELLLPPKIVDVVNNLPDIETNISTNGSTVSIKSGSANFTLNADPEISSFPDLEVTDGQPFTVDNFSDLLKSVIFAASTDDSRPAFNGVLFEVKDGVLSLTASDTYRLAVASGRVDTGDYRGLIPARPLREALKLLDAPAITLSDKHISFTTGDTTLQIRLLDEKYPEVAGVIPAEHKTTVTATREGLNKPLADTLQRAMLVTDVKNHSVNLSVADNVLTVSVDSQVGSLEESLPVNQTGDNVSLILNAKYLADVLSWDGIEIFCNGSDGPVVVKRPGYDYTYLLLPIKKMD